jgi:hypothetical protein
MAVNSSLDPGDLAIECGGKIHAHRKWANSSPGATLRLRHLP